MDSKTFLMILKNRARLSKMIEENASPEKIIRQSRILDKYILKQMYAMNKIES